MTFEKPGIGTSAVEVTNVSKHGLWLLLHDQEVFLDYDNFPWFRNATIGKVVHVELISDQHLSWPELDIDLEVDSIFFPERYPLVDRVHESAEEYKQSAPSAEPDLEKIDDCVLALLQLTLHDEMRAWKGFDFEVMDRLFQKGFIRDPRNKNKSIVLTREGLARSEKLWGELFERRQG